MRGYRAKAGVSIKRPGQLADDVFLKILVGFSMRRRRLATDHRHRSNWRKAWYYCDISIRLMAS
jgi:hypothetical protein